MDEALSKQWMMADQDQQISDAIERERPRLRNFIRKRVTDRGDAEDILQDVFSELIEAYRLMKPVEEVTAWLFRVTRNRITDLFRSRTRETHVILPADLDAADTDLHWEDLLPSPDAGPDSAFARGVMLDEVEAALDELPAEQREAFIAHELMGQSFKKMAAQTGVSMNTLLSRKRYAVLYLRQRLQAIYDDFMKA